MRNIIVLTVLFCAATGAAYADDYVRGYFKSDGTYVAPHYRSSPNNTPYDNWSTRGNVNPYTGQQGAVTPQPNFNTNRNSVIRPNGGLYQAPGLYGQPGIYGRRR
ncbi:MAG: hypothetical protein RIA64_01550 [Rhodospirillales bacterium]